MNGKLLILSTDAKIISEESLRTFNHSKISNPQISALALDNPINLFKNYHALVESGHVPLILNPQIPKDKLLEIAKVLNASRLESSEGVFDLDHTDSEIQSGHHILCSSGTTSGGVVGKKFIFSIEDSIRNGLSHLKSINIDSPRKILLPMPVTHSFGLVGGLLGSTYGGHELYTFESGNVSASLILEAIQKYKIDHLYLTPSLLKMMTKYLKRKGSITFKLGSLSIGSSMLFTDDLLSLMPYFPETRFYFTYGLTEMGPRAFTFDAGLGSNPHPFLKENPGTPVPIGQPIEGIEYKISDDQLFIKSPYKAQNIADEFFPTQDRGDMTSVGVRVHGRMDFTIIKSGINIYPSEVEALLSDISEVIDCVLIPQKSESYGQVPVLLIYTNSDDSLISVVSEHLKKNLPPNHLPSKIVLRNNDFPRTSMGKIKVAALVEELNNEQS